MKPSLVIIGLGNPGKQYERTRHNAGFLALDVLAEAFGEGDWKDAQKFNAISLEARILTFPVLLLKPTTFMNLSGQCVAKVVDFYKLDPASQILVISDDIDIPLGELRLKKKGGPGTHNGLKSVAERFGEQYPRLRVGIGPKPQQGDLAAWVLSRFSEEEHAVLKETFSALPDLVKSFVVGE